ncbi:hypothetical protein [Micromonospora craniellae]|nr:hypothetical protein [Micromonospora craniellae]
MFVARRVTLLLITPLAIPMVLTPQMLASTGARNVSLVAWESM